MDVVVVDVLVELDATEVVTLVGGTLAEVGTVIVDVALGSAPGPQLADTRITKDRNARSL
ncbi:MAG TPA: hypothetical protein VF115_15285 [Acidimicrobiia bacterium]